MKASWLILLVELLPSFLAQQEVSSKLSESCSTFANNTLGSCACSGQLFFNDDCQHGFFCMDDADFPTPEDAAMYDGCAIECASDEILLVDARNGGGWMCRKWHGGTPLICPGHFNTECACNGGPDACPMGDCECDGQLWVSNDCKAAKSCTGTAEGGFEHQDISCPEENQILYVHLVSHIWYCGDDDGKCPGAFDVGCQADQTEAPTQDPTEEPTTMPASQCTLAKNTLGECGCGKQLFVGDECKKGFYCMEDDEFPTEEDALQYDGCEIECADDETLYVDPRLGGSWKCMKRIGPMPMWCPGKFNTECGCNDGPDACPIGECECDGQLRVAHDCKTAKYCNETVAGGFDTITCTNDELVYVNLVTHKWNCGEDDGRCPGAFHVGCQEDGPTEEPTDEPDTQRPFTLCSYAKNDLGTCECPGQVFIAHECHKGFMCMDFTDGNFPDSVVNGGFDGCVKECRDDEVLVVDPRRGDWECVPTVVNATFLNEVCPGKFNTECACTGGEAECPIGECECQGQLRVAHDCHDARYCNGTDLANPNDHLDINCPAPNIVYVNMATNAWECGLDDGRCPGAFHVGCRDDSYNGSNNLGFSAIMASLLPMFVTYVYSMIRV